MKKFILFIVSMLFAISANAANLIVNGSFEDPDVATGNWQVFGSIPGWSTTGAGIEIRDNVVGTAFDGQQFAELDSHGAVNTNSSIFQDVSTTNGQSYLLSFAYSPRINQPAATNGIEVYWNNALLDSVTAAGGGSHNWTVFEYIVVGTAGTDTLKFSAIGLDDSVGGSLDAVSINAVPIPAAVFLFGPALLGFLGLRRKATTTS